MGEAELKIVVFHRIYLALLTASGMAWLGTAALFVRWEMNSAIRCLRGYREKKQPLRGRKEGKAERTEKADEGTEEKTEVLERKSERKQFRMEREWLGIHSRERIGGER